MESGETLDNPKTIQNYTMSFFIKLYTTEQSRSFWGNNLGNATDRNPDTPLRDSDIILVVNSFKPTKAPRPDDLYPLFY